MKLLEALVTALESDTVPPTVWACLWLSDIDYLRERVREAQTPRPPILKAHFALRPIGLSDDKKHLDVEFFWLAKGNRASDGDLAEIVMTILQR
jgi:hypothetical protein